jgi:hypothetical protein
VSTLYRFFFLTIRVILQLLKLIGWKWDPGENRSANSLNFPWNSMKFFRNIWRIFFIIFFHGIPWKIPWNSMEFHWIFHGIPCNETEVDGIGISSIDVIWWNSVLKTGELHYVNLKHINYIHTHTPFLYPLSDLAGSVFVNVSPRIILIIIDDRQTTTNSDESNVKFRVIAFKVQLRWPLKSLGHGHGHSFRSPFCRGDDIQHA